MLPRLAAMVCMVTTGIIFSFFPTISKITMVNGTKVISATSLVMIILEKKQSATNIPARDAVLAT